MTAHQKAQLLRFLRATFYALVPALAATGGRLRWWDLLTLLAGAAEAGLRQVFPVQEATAVPAGPPAAEAPPPGQG